MTNMVEIELLPCRTKYRHKRGNWSDVYPVERLESWISFYRRLSQNRPSHYGPDLRALLMFQKTAPIKAIEEAPPVTPENWQSIGGIVQKIIEGQKR